MKMKKTVIGIVAGIFLTASAGMAMAGMGTLDLEAEAHPAPVIDGSYTPVPFHSGGAGGISGAIAGNEAGAKGIIINGVVSGGLQSSATALTETNSNLYSPHIGDLSIGVASSSRSIAETTGSVNVMVDPQFGFGMVGGHVSGIAAQGTLNGSHLTESPLFFESEGDTSGIAAQGSIGGFEGHVGAVSGPDYYYGRSRRGNGYYVKVNGETAGEIKYFKHHPENESEWRFLGRHRVDSYAAAGAGASILMDGGSYSNSYRFVDFGPESKTEGMGTFVGADTTVITSGFAYGIDNGLAGACAHINGGYIVAGGAASKTVQTLDGASGMATAKGTYMGSGQLGSNFYGSVTGQTHTAITTYDNMKGSTVGTYSQMTVISNTTNGGGQYVD